VDHPEVAGGAFALAGVLIADGGFIGLEVAALEQVAVDEFVGGSRVSATTLSQWQKVWRGMSTPWRTLKIPSVR
jgi:hypothetical protein